MVNDYELKTQYQEDDERKDHRLHSEYVKILYDEGQELNIASSSKKRQKTENQDDAVKLNRVRLFEKLSEILEDVEIIHKVIR